GEAERPVRGRQAAAGIGEVDAPVGAGHDIIGSVEAVPAQTLGDRRIGPVGLPACALAVLALTDEQPAMQIEGHPIGAAALLADDLRLATGPQPVDSAGAY